MSNVIQDLENQLERIVSDLRTDLATTTDWAFGALFIGHKDGKDFGLIFARDMPQEARMSLLEDLQSVIDHARKAWRQ